LEFVCYIQSMCRQGISNTAVISNYRFIIFSSTVGTIFIAVHPQSYPYLLVVSSTATLTLSHLLALLLLTLDLLFTLILNITVAQLHSTTLTRTHTLSLVLRLITAFAASTLTPASDRTQCNTSALAA
jgi:hypothetical protein